MLSDMTIIYVLVNLLLGAVGWFIQQRLASIKEDLKEIKTQVYITNGRVGRLEEWKALRDKADDEKHRRIDMAFDKLWDLTKHISKRDSFDNGPS